ncbi:MAG: LysE family translocator, partial [Pseudomonadota bacterium]
MSDLPLYLPGILAAYSILLVGASSPGPAVAMLLGISTTQGRTQSLIASLGIATGSMTINILTMAGIGLLLSEAAWAMTALRIIGATYLIWLAWGALRKAIDPPSVTVTQVTPKPASVLFWQGYLLQVTNPKAIAFWLAIASVGAVIGAGPVIIGGFVLGAFVISFAAHGAWSIMLSTRPFRAAYARARRWIEAALGAFFVFAA